MEQAIRGNSSVLCAFEGDGDVVITPANAYADMVDQIQTVSKNVSVSALFEDAAEGRED